jgi:hypothetical protein
MAATNGIDFGPYYEMTIGQLLLIEDNAIRFRLLTDPFASEDDGTSSRSRSRSAPRQDTSVSEAMYNARTMKARLQSVDGMGVDIRHVTREEWGKRNPEYEHFLRDLEVKDAGK